MSKIDSIESSFMVFLEDYKNDQGVTYGTLISTLPVEGKQSLVINFADIYNFDPDLADAILDTSIDNSAIFTTVLRSKLRLCNPDYAENTARVYVRFRSLLTEIPLRNIGANQIGKLFTVSGIIVRASPVKPKLLRASFMCPACGEITHIKQDDQTLQTPQKCAACDNRKNFQLVPIESEWVDTQRLTIQESPDSLPSGQLPRSISIELLDDLVDTARPGDRINTIGILKMVPTYGRSGQLTTFDFFLEANNLEVKSEENELLELTQQDIDEILELAKDPMIYEKMVQSVCPSLYGLRSEKEAVLLLLFGGVNKTLEDVRIRGDSHVLFVGDPGVGKTQLQSFAAKAAPRGLFTTGRGSTAAGLTAAVVKESGNGGYVLEAGALVLTDQGVCVIDEFEKMRDEDRGAIHTAMEQQIVPIAKAGIVATLNARSSILASANPMAGRWNPYQTVAQNIGHLSAPMLTRFDLIFVIKDTINEVIDGAIADHIVNIHTENKQIKPPIGLNLLRKYISYSKQINPKLSKTVGKTFESFYQEMRKTGLDGGGNNTIAITARHLESLIRLAEARARAHLRETVTEEDAKAVIEVMRVSLSQVGINPETGKPDIDQLYGYTGDKQDKLRLVLEAVNTLERVNGNAKDSDLYELLEEDQGYTNQEIRDLLGILMKDGTIFMSRPGYYRRTS